VDRFGFRDFLDLLLKERGGAGKSFSFTVFTKRDLEDVLMNEEESIDCLWGTFEIKDSFNFFSRSAIDFS
jgi:hypothetical protein